jgi:hypothetical protein
VPKRQVAHLLHRSGRSAGHLPNIKRATAGSGGSARIAQVAALTAQARRTMCSYRTRYSDAESRAVAVPCQLQCLQSRAASGRGEGRQVPLQSHTSTMPMLQERFPCCSDATSAAARCTSAPTLVVLCTAWTITPTTAQCLRCKRVQAAAASAEPLSCMSPKTCVPPGLRVVNEMYVPSGDHEL